MKKDVHGPHHLDISVRDSGGHETYTSNFEVTAAGGEAYGQLLKAAVTVPITGAAGMFIVEASLRDPQGHLVATGHDQVLAVDWKSQKLAGKGATQKALLRYACFSSSKKICRSNT